MVRGALLLAIAVILGVVLLNTFDDGEDPFAQNLVAAGQTTTTTTTEVEAPVATTTTVAAPAVRPPADVKILALNGTAVRGLGARLRDELAVSGFNVLAPDDSTDANKPIPTTLVFSTPGYENEAADVATRLSLAATAVQTGAPPAKPQAMELGPNVIVVAGADYAARPAQ
jgi:hypothetical protein